MTTTDKTMTDPDAMQRRHRSRMILLTVIASAALVFLLIGIWMRSLERDQSVEIARQIQLPELGTVSSTVSFTERSGRSMTINDLKGKFWIADFIFTRCQSVCPVMSTKMADLQKSLHKAKNVRLVSFTVDPEYDTPERLAAYAESYEADRDQWLFLRTDRKQMQDLAQKQFKLTAFDDGTTNPDAISHSERFVLLDTSAVIRGYYNSNERESMQRLLTDLGVLMKQQAGSR